MTQTNRDEIKLYGRVFITGQIEAVTGLHIGSTEAAFSIGGVDKTVIVNPLNGQPYIPGSSLRGKMRSLTEKYMGVKLRSAGRAVKLHEPETKEEYENSQIAQLYGVAAADYSLPTRLIVRDLPLTAESVRDLQRSKSDLPFREVKTEVSIDRVTSQANPRTIERVLAGAVFGPMELVVSIYQFSDIDLIELLIDGMLLLEDDYLGGHGARGSGRVRFINLAVSLKSSADYRSPVTGTYDNLETLANSAAAIIETVRQTLFGGAT